MRAAPLEPAGRGDGDAHGHHLYRSLWATSVGATVDEHPDASPETPVLVPIPLPTYTLAPDLAPLEGGEQRALEAALGGLTGRLHGVVVTAVGTTLSHHVIELMTSAGTLLVLERVADHRDPVAA